MLVAYAHLVIDGVLQAALLGREAVAQGFELIVVGGGRQLRLDAGLEAGLCFRHQFGAHIVPAAKVGGRDGDGDGREVPHLAGSTNAGASVSTVQAERVVVWREWEAAHICDST